MQEVKPIAYVCHEKTSDPGVLVCERRPGPHASYQDSVQAWQERHDDAALMAIADRVEQQQQIAVADELHASAQVSKTSLTRARAYVHGLTVMSEQSVYFHPHLVRTLFQDRMCCLYALDQASMAYILDLAKEQCHTCLLPIPSCMTVGVQAGEEEPIDLCDSDDDAPAQQPTGVQEHCQHSQAAAHSPEARRLKQQPAPRPGPKHIAEAVRILEAKRLKAGAMPKPAQRAETRQLGITDSRPPKLSGNNALLKELAQGTNRVRQLPDNSHMSVSQTSNGGPCDCCLAAEYMPAVMLQSWLECQALRAPARGTCM